MSERMDVSALTALVMKERHEGHFDGDVGAASTTGYHYAERFALNIAAVISATKARRGKEKAASA